MSDMFSRNIGYAGTIKPETAFFSDASGGILASGIVTSVEVGYQQQVSRMWSLFGNGTTEGGGCRVWFVAGDTQGRLQLGTLYGAGNVGGNGDICAPSTCSLKSTGATACGTAAASAVPSETLTMNTCVVSSYGFTGSASGSMSITKNVGLEFLSMSSTP